MAIMPGEDTSNRPKFIPGILTVWFSRTATLRTVGDALATIKGKIIDSDFHSCRFSIEIEPGQEDEMIGRLSSFKSMGDILSIEKQDIAYIASS